MAEEQVVENEEVTEDQDQLDVDNNEETERSSDHFSADFKDEKIRNVASRYNTTEDLAKAVYDLRGKLSSARNEKASPPDEEADEVEISEFREAFGIPEDPSGYDFFELEGEYDTEENREEIGRWQKLFHDNNVPSEAAAAILEMYGADVIAAKEAEIAADAQYAEQTQAELKKAWGAEYDTNVAFANQAVATLFGDDFEDVKAIQDSTGKFIMDHPAFVKAFSNIGREMGEGQLAGPLSESEVESIEDRANSYREKAREAQARGKTAEANKWSAKELAELEKLDRVGNN